MWAFITFDVINQIIVNWKNELIHLFVHQLILSFIVFQQKELDLFLLQEGSAPQDAHYGLADPVGWAYLYLCQLLYEWSLTNCHIDGLVQNCSISDALALEILQSYTEPSIWDIWKTSKCYIQTCFSDQYADFLCNSPRVNTTIAYWWWVNNGSGNGLVLTIYSAQS